MRMPAICGAQATDSKIKHEVTCCPAAAEPRTAAFSNSPAEHFLCTPDTYLFCESDDRASTHIHTHSSLDRPENRGCLRGDRAFSFVSSRSLQIIPQTFCVSSLRLQNWLDSEKMYLPRCQVVRSTSLTRRAGEQSCTDAV